MKIAIASDARGYKLKSEIISSLNEYEFLDFGTDNDTDKVDYPIYAIKVGNSINNNESDFGILICRTGIGMSIAANKIKGIRAAKVSNEEEASLTRLDNDANIMTLSCQTSLEDATRIIKTFITTEASIEERHIRRRKMIEELENDN